MRKTIQLMLALCLCAKAYGGNGDNKKSVQQVISDLQAQDENFNPVNLFQSPQQRTVEGIGDYFYFTLDEAKLKNAFKAKYRSVRMVLLLPGNDSVSLLLTQHKILTDDFVLSVTNGKGEQPAPYEPGLYYRGIVEGNEKSHVAISIFKDHLGGVISDESGNWNLGQLGREGRAQTNANEYVYFNDKSFTLPVPPNVCGTTDDHANDNRGSSRSLAAGDCVRLFFDCDYDFYVYKSSNTTAVGDYVTLLFNVQSILYGNESITLALSGVNVWTVADPFNLGDSQSNMYAYSDYRRTNFNGDLAQLLAKDAGGLGGIAWINVLCANYGSTSHVGPISYCDINASYSAGSLTFPTYTWDASATSHELGHNFGSRHTHWCGWTGGPIDNCITCWNGLTFEGSCTSGPNPPATGGTIMSYCHGCSGIGINFLAGFGQQPGDLIRSRVAAASCLAACETECAATVTVNTPITSGSAQYAAADIVYGSSTIQSGANVSFTAGDAVILSVGFQAQTGSTFTGAIGACSAVASTPTTESSTASSFEGDSLNALPASSVENAREGIALSAYPNPFTHAVTISFSLPSPEKVTLEIISMDGRLLATLFNEMANENQLYRVEFHSGSLENGMYFYRMVTESGFVQNKKLLLIR